MTNNYVNRTHKDTLFKLIFGEHKDCALALYNAVNGTSYTDIENLQIVTLKDAMYIGRKDDTAYIFHDVLSIFEQQASYNPNMPLRGLGYVADSYKEYIAETYENNQIFYSGILIRIPAPRYYVLYNGSRDQPENVTIRLSDAYEGSGDVEVIAHMLNINKGHNEILMDACKPLKDYSELVDRVRINKKKSLSDEEAVDLAVNSCINDGILADILSKERARVENILIAGITEEEFLQLKENEYQQKLNAAEKKAAQFELLTKKLLDLNKIDELRAAADDENYRERLYQQYSI